MEKPATEIEVIARGVCIVRDWVLLCHSIGAQNTFLPGGHVEFRERARQSLEREIGEELGLPCSAGEFLGGVEHAFEQRGVVHCEINLVFRLDVPGLKPDTVPVTREAGIEFRWCGPDRLREARLEPRVLCDLFPRWRSGRDPAADWATSGSSWAD